jgi:hypothetical protein
MKLNTKIGIGLAILILFILVMAVVQVVYNPPQTVTTSADRVSHLNETFNRSDFIYGPQAWKPYGTKTLPIVSGEDPNGNNNFSIMFVDLYATPFGIDNLTNYTGGIKVEYSFTNLTGMAAFNIYGFAKHSNNLGNIPGTFMTNRASYPASGSDTAFYVYGDSSLAGSVPTTQSLGLNMISVKVANNEGPAFDVNNNGTYPIMFIQPGGGLNALHFTTAADSNKRTDFGSLTVTHDQSGVFYISDTGGAGISDVILMVAVNGTIPDSFSLHLNASMDDRSVFE